MEQHERLVEDLLKDASFQRWAAGEASEEERRRWEQWIRRGTERQEAAREAARAVRLARFKPPAASGDADAAWARLRRERSRRARRSAFRRERRPVPSGRRRHTAAVGSAWRRRAAAVLVIALVGLGLWRVGVQPDPGAAPAETIVTTEYDERTTLTLSGGTVIMLNANSRLRLSVGADGQPAREVYLEGEAFFDVARVGEGANRRPFLVHTADGTIRVLGTRFSVARRERRTRVALNEGEVAVHVSRRTPAGEAAAGEAAVTLRPGQLAAFGPESEAVRVHEVNPKVYSSWTTNTLVFDETPVAVIARRIEHTYGLEVRAEDRSVLRETVSGQVENDLRVLISGLSRLLDRPIYRSEGVIVIQ